jgi:hypothetical protein
LDLRPSFRTEPVTRQVIGGQTADLLKTIKEVASLAIGEQSRVGVLGLIGSDLTPEVFDGLRRLKLQNGLITLRFANLALTLVDYLRAKSLDERFVQFEPKAPEFENDKTGWIDSRSRAGTTDRINRGRKLFANGFAVFTPVGRSPARRYRRPPGPSLRLDSRLLRERNVGMLTLASR